MTVDPTTTITIDLDSRLNAALEAKARKLGKTPEWVILRCAERELLGEVEAMGRAVFRGCAGSEDGLRRHPTESKPEPQPVREWEPPKRIMMCANPEGLHEHIEIDGSDDPAVCFAQRCECQPVEYLLAAPVVEVLREIVEGLSRAGQAAAAFGLVVKLQQAGVEIEEGDA